MINMADFSDDELLAELGISLEETEAAPYTAREERLLAGWEDIQRFYAQHGRLPQNRDEHGDIFERLYAVRLQRLRDLPEAHALLAAHDPEGWLRPSAPSAEPTVLDDDALLAELGLTGIEAESSIHSLRHVRSFEERQAAAEIAERKRCEDFDQFAALFQQVQADLATGERQTLPFAKVVSIEQGDFFIVDGLVCYVAAYGEPIRAPNGKMDARLRVIFANGTESNLLMRSLQRALFKDENGRRITQVNPLPLFDAAEPQPEPAWEAEDLPSGTIYVLRSHSDHPLIAAHRELIHKIGVTGGAVAKRISQAAVDPTYLLAEVDVVATYRLANLNRTKLEKLFHRLFGAVQIDLALVDRFGHAVCPREWFMVPLSVIDEAVQRIQDGSIVNCVYDPQQGRLVSNPHPA